MRNQYQLRALQKTVRERFATLRSRIPYRKTVVFLRRKPFTSFFITLGILLAVIVAGSILHATQPEEERKELVKAVTTYSIGQKPAVTVQASVEKTGVVTILAQTAGIVETVHVKEGQNVTKGNSLVSLVSSYSGGSAPGVQAQIAREQYKNIQETYQTQKDLIKSQRELAEKTSENSEEMRLISQRSLGDTQELLRFNENMLTLVNQAIGNSPSDLPQDLSNPLQQTRGQLLGSVIQVRSQLRSLEYQADATKPPSELASLQKDATLKQLTIQDKALDMQKEVTRLQAALAGINESLMRPATPFSGTVQRVFVRPGQSVSPGAQIATVSEKEHALIAIAQVPYELAKGISATEESIFMVGGKEIRVAPAFVSTDATDGQLYSIKYELPIEFEKQLTDKETVTVSIPVGGLADSTNTTPFVPLDAVYQTQDTSSVFVIVDGKARAKTVQLGNVFGRFVEVSSGIARGDSIILTRNVVENDPVRPN